VVVPRRSLIQHNETSFTPHFHYPKYQAMVMHEIHVENQPSQDAETSQILGKTV
jgi:hypothetical protein